MKIKSTQWIYKKACNLRCKRANKKLRTKREREFNKKILEPIKKED